MAKTENKSHLSTIRPTQLKAKKKTANYSVTIENLHNLVHSDFRECSLFILFWRGGWLHHGGKKSLRCFLAVGGGGHEGFFMSLDRNLNAYFISKFIEIPSNSLFISSRITRCQILDIKFFEEQEQYFFFRVNLQLLKLQLPLQLSYLQLISLIIVLVNVFYNTWAWRLESN